MNRNIKRIVDYVILIPTIIWLVIIGFIGQPIVIFFENEEYTVALRQAETINQIFRIAIFFTSAILISWYLFRPNRVLKYISFFICAITIAFTILYFKEIIDYRDIIYLKTI